MIWTVNLGDGNFAVVSAESVEVAREWVRKALADRGQYREIRNADLIPFPSSGRKVRLLLGGRKAESDGLVSDEDGIHDGKVGTVDSVGVVSSEGSQ